MQNTKQKPALLLPVTESPAGRSPEPSTGGGMSAAAVGMQAIRPSPLGRNVVTALEAELDQVQLASTKNPAFPESREGFLHAHSFLIFA